MDNFRRRVGGQEFDIAQYGFFRGDYRNGYYSGRYYDYPKLAVDRDLDGNTTVTFRQYLQGNNASFQNSSLNCLLSGAYYLKISVYDSIPGGKFAYIYSPLVNKTVPYKESDMYKYFYKNTNPGIIYITLLNSTANTVTIDVRFPFSATLNDNELPSEYENYIRLHDEENYNILPKDAFFLGAIGTINLDSEDAQYIPIYIKNLQNNDVQIPSIRMKIEFLRLDSSTFWNFVEKTFKLSLENV